MKLVNLYMSNEQQFYTSHRIDAAAAHVVSLQSASVLHYLMRNQVFRVVMSSSRILHAQRCFKLSGINKPTTQHSNLKDQKPQISQVTTCESSGFCDNMVDDSIPLDIISHH